MKVTDECERLGLRAYPVKDAADVEILRMIRNVCKDGFSADNHEITQAEQAAWWDLMHERVKAWLYTATARDTDGETGLIPETIGYGLLRQTDDGRWWTSVAVVPEAAGHGYGGAITADLARRSDVTVWASARLDNPAAMRLHRESDWEETHRDERLAHFRTRPHVHLKQSLDEWSKYGWAIT